MISSATTKTLQTKQQDNLQLQYFHFNFCLIFRLYSCLQAWSAWVTPPVALFLGLIFALTCGPWHIPNLIKDI